MYMNQDSSNNSSNNINIWQQALKLKSSQLSQSNNQKTLIIIGNQNSGKTTLIKLLKTDSISESKPTILFDYSYIKKQSLNKQIIHCYQLSNKSQQQIMPSLISKQTFNKTKIILCIDLSKPQQILQTVKQWIDIIRKQIQTAVRQKIGLEDKIKQYQQDVNKFMNGNQDIALVKPLPIQTIIIGSKYDQLEKYDLEDRKWIARLLRYYAHVNHMHLFYSSTINPTLISQIRNIFNQVLFNSKRTTYYQRDHLKPIFVSRGQDTILNLNIQTVNNMNVFDIIKKQFIAIFGNQNDQNNNKKATGQIDLLKYTQNRIDNLIQQRKKENNKINARVNARQLNAGKSKFS